MLRGKYPRTGNGKREVPRTGNADGKRRGKYPRTGNGKRGRETPTGLWPLVGALFALGLGWNLAYVAASALLSDQLAPAERSRTQGLGDLVINTASGLAQIASGVVCAKAGYPAVCAVAAAAALVPVAILFAARHRMRSATR
jgi:MFS family permease